GRGPSRNPRLLVPETARAAPEGAPGCRRRGDQPQAPGAPAEPAPVAVLQAGGPGPQGARPGPRGPGPGGAVPPRRPPAAGHGPGDAARDAPGRGGEAHPRGPAAPGQGGRLPDEEG